MAATLATVTPLPLAECLSWKLIDKNGLHGVATIRFPSDVIFCECPVFRKPEGTGYQARPASRPRIGRDGTPMLDASGKQLRDRVVDFASTEARDRWSAAVLDAIKRAHPDALA